MHAFALKNALALFAAGAVAILLALCEAVRHSSQEALEIRPPLARLRLPVRRKQLRDALLELHNRDGRHGSVACLPNGTMLFLHEKNYCAVSWKLLRPSP